MKKILILFLAACGIVSTLAAQTYNFTWSPVFTIEQKGEVNKQIIHTEDGGFILLRSIEGAFPQDYDYIVIKFNSALKQEFLVNLTPGYGRNDSVKTFVNLLNTKDKLVVIYQNFIKADQKTYMEYAEISEDGDLSETKKLGNVATQKQGERPETQAAVSPDGSRFCIMAKLDHQKKTNEKWKVWSYIAGNETPAFEQEIETDIESDGTVFNEVFINNTGNVQVFKRYSVKKEGYKYAIYTITPQSPYTKTLLDLGAHEITDKKIFFNTKGNLSVCGLYYNTGKYWSPCTGTFLCVFDENGALTTNTLEYFGSMVLKLVYPKSSKAEKEDVHLTDQKLRSIIEDENGEITIVFENYEQSTRSIPGSTDPFLMDIDRVHKDAVIIRLSDKGNKVWAQLFEKKQTYTTRDAKDFWGGVVTLVNNGNVHLIHNVTNLPTIIKKILPEPGWQDGENKKHFKSDEFGGQSYYATFAANFNNLGELQPSISGYNNSQALVKMYSSGAIYELAFSTIFYETNKNVGYLIMEMPGDDYKSQTKWQVCRVTVE